MAEDGKTTARMTDDGLLVLTKDGVERTYKTVARRVAEFRGRYSIESGWRIITECLQATDELVRFKALIKNPSGGTVATGHAEETREGRINLTSAVENCETSAVGRALAAAGFGGAEYASADELAAALEQQQQIVDDRAEFLGDLLAAIKDGDDQRVRELWDSLELRKQDDYWRYLDNHKRGEIRKMLQRTYEAEKTGA